MNVFLDDLLQYYDTIWDKVNADINLIANLFMIKAILKAKIKSYSDEATDFHNNEYPKAGPNPTCLAVITIDTALKKEENFYPQVFLKECKYIEKETIRHIIKDLEVSSYEFDEE